MDLQIDKVDDALKAGLWDALMLHFFNDVGSEIDVLGNGGYTDTFFNISRRLWHLYYKKTIDSLSSNPLETRWEIRRHFLESDFPETYDFIEFMAQQDNDQFIEFCNRILEREKSVFRFVGNQLAPITNETELAEIEQAVEQTQSETVSKHLGKAVSFYSNRENPDYPHAITESFKAVEEAARLLTGDKNATLGGAIKNLKADGRVHTAFADGVSKLFGWTSDTMRHAAKDQVPETGEAEARFMLVNCSAMANYLLSLSEET
ncbi:hypothetical protein BAR1_01425 [Profundibacter amoris]|uniref:HEPN AbiJ-N-terminal domain-containing protein n=2 Tax=Profundibacter amoris TaxID=2171755 RepID=A0A347UCY5_9RHOB|nr:hypothetical protein BAR1_01425 [Profundibacter amoris]